MNKFTKQELAELYKKAAEGGKIEFRYPTRTEWKTTNCGPTPLSSPNDWRIQPAKKIVDLSVLIDGIDCEFSDESKFSPTTTRIAKLKSVGKGPNYHASNSPNQYLYCRPRMNHKHAWQGGKCPLPEGFIVRLTKWSVHVPNISHIELTTEEWLNSWSNEHTTTQAFEVLRVADGYVMPWENSDG
jgi:hypothetical protein